MIPGPDQLNATPAVPEDPFRLTEDAEHVSVCVVPALAPGGFAFDITAT